MNAWLVEIQRLVRIVIGDPSSPVQFWAAFGLGLIALFVAAQWMAKMFKFTMGESGRISGVLAAWFALTLLVVVPLDLYLGPRLGGALQTWLPLIGAVVVFFAGAVPLCCFITKTKYGPSVSALLISVAAAAALILLTHAVFAATRSAGKDLGKTRKHRAGLNEVLEQ